MYKFDAMIDNKSIRSLSYDYMGIKTDITNLQHLQLFQTYFKRPEAFMKTETNS